MTDKVLIDIPVAWIPGIVMGIVAIFACGRHLSKFLARKSLQQAATPIDKTQRQQALMQLHDKQLISTRTLMEEMGLDYEQELKNLREAQSQTILPLNPKVEFCTLPHEVRIDSKTPITAKAEEEEYHCRGCGKVADYDELDDDEICQNCRDEDDLDDDDDDDDYFDCDYDDDDDYWDDEDDDCCDECGEDFCDCECETPGV